MTATNAERCLRYRLKHPDRVKEFRRIRRANPERKARENARQNELLKVKRSNLSTWATTAIVGIRSRAKRRGIEFAITVKDLDVPTHCPVLGIPLKVGHRTRTNSSPSVDRFDNSRGYVPGNVRIISNRANLIKNDATLYEIRQVLSYMEGRL